MFTTHASLIDRLQQDPGQEAWGRFVELYSPLLFAWAHRLGQSEHDTADLVQEVYAILVEHLPRFKYDPQRSFRAWLKTVLLNAWRKQRVRLAAARGSEPLLDDIPDNDPRLHLDEEEYNAHVVGQALALMKSEFAPLTWQACWEFVVQDRPAAEVAKDLNLTVNAVYLAKSRILRRLRTELRGFVV